MVDHQVSQSLYNIWEIDTEPNASVGEKIREWYKQRAKKHLEEIGAI